MGANESGGGTEPDRLVRLARARGFELTPRRIASWRRSGLLPRRRRNGGGREDPPGTDAQVLRLAELRGQVRSIDLTRILLWAEGYPLEPDPVRIALRKSVERLVDQIGDGGDKDGEIVAIARRLASSRTRAPLERGDRMSLDERTRAYACLVALLLGDAEGASREEADMQLLAKMLGAGAGAALGGLLGPPGGGTAAPLLRPSQLARAIDSASDAELEAARRAFRVGAAWWPLMLSLLGEARPGGEGLAQLAQEQWRLVGPELLPLLLAGFVAAARDPGPRPAVEPREVDTPSPTRGGTQRAIIEAGVAVVARLGFDGLTYREVAREAGTTHGTVGYHFRTREQLIHEIALEARRVAVAGSSIVPADGRLESFAGGVAESARDDLDAHLFQYELALQARRRPELAGEMRSLYEGYFDLTRQALEEVGLDPDEDLVRFVFAAIDGLVIHQVVDDDAAATEAALDELRKLLAEGAADDG